MVREKGSKGKFKKEKKKKTDLNLKNGDMHWLAASTQFDKGNN